ncbi:ClpXP adapter SpxH family protein [Paraliobacillus salinarum]|uniref:ClpXP adapter SpxH family protein n=1 Tax=Paraliobacillus salinarum TaxID=1158996 RepID=UPI0015F3D93F|nr:ClpXP adapter SpxH family protein [Paraliobacillus salinarum]
MSWNQSGPSNYATAQLGYFDLLRKPIEIYLFIDPLCPESWSLEPLLKKLMLEYGRFFTIRPIISSRLSSFNQEKGNNDYLKQQWERTSSLTGMCCDGDLWKENPVNYPSMLPLAIKAAELQGKKAGKRYLRKIQECVFLNKRDISIENNLITCAYEANLDIVEFKKDLYSNSAKKALQCDLKLVKEMEIDYTPSIVFFNQSVDDDGLKLSGVYPYEIYVKVLKQMLEKEVKPVERPSLEEFIAYYGFVATKEVAVVYDWSLERTVRELKKLKLKQIVYEFPVKYGSFWEYRN